jgi:prepilin-type N-terminal cleavage/methylation domain-containing protein
MKKRSARGYSLVEVLIAVAITGFVLLSVVTLFYLGRRNVYSGKQMTYAVSVGTRVMEDLSSMTTGDVLSNFGITDATNRQDVILCGNNLLPLGTTTCPAFNLSQPGYSKFTLSTERDTDTISGATDPQHYLQNWSALVTNANLTNGRVGVIITPRSPTDLNAPWTTAQFTRIRVIVQWDEAKGRTRSAFFDTSKVNR